MGDGGFVNVNVNVNESSNRFYRRGAENAEGMAPALRRSGSTDSLSYGGQAERGPTEVRSFWGRIDEGGAGDRVET